MASLSWLISLAELVALAAGAAIMGLALASAHGVAARLAQPALRRAWRAMSVLTAFFVVAYLAYAATGALSREVHARLERGLIPVVLLAGAAFVALTYRLALRTVDDLQRVALLERENAIDHLTSLYNRRFFERRLAEEFAHARRHGLPLALLVLDVDHFKRINDTHGHAAGDAVLRDLAARLLGAVRAYDVVARYGGEEFAVIAPSTRRADALRLAERLREVVAAQPLALRDDTGAESRIGYTTSVGVAELDASMGDAAALFAAADAALYRAKRDGRNRVRSSAAAPDPLAGAQTT